MKYYKSVKVSDTQVVVMNGPHGTIDEAEKCDDNYEKFGDTYGKMVGRVRVLSVVIIQLEPDGIKLIHGEKYTIENGRLSGMVKDE